MTNKPPDFYPDRLARLQELFPGAAPDTGWPLEPTLGCYKAADAVLCYLAIAPGLQCVYQPPGCPFFGKFPELSQNDKQERMI